MEFDFDGEAEAAVTLGEQLGGAGGDGAEQALFARMDKVADDAAGEAAQSLLAEAMASSFGLVEKVDFDSLTFETDDE
ncbi:MAG TPA: hypothetical protein OIL86_15255 [Eggerthellaceae bacterium]|nr:hypothetical protein [Eggerthellaceae bacterium]